MALRDARRDGAGGMRDHIGGGFHRYSVDAAWRVPHFEKMLYDQAQLVLAFLEGAAGVRRSVLRRGRRGHAPVRHARDDRRGGRLLFRRGRRQPAARATWASPAPTRRKARSICGARASSTRSSATTQPIVSRRFGIEPDGNAPADPQQEFTGKNLLYLARSVDEIANELREERRTRSSAALDRARLRMFEAPRRRGRARTSTTRC